MLFELQRIAKVKILKVAPKAGFIFKFEDFQNLLKCSLE